jgi:hypothetical protein
MVSKKANEILDGKPGVGEDAFERPPAQLIMKGHDQGALVRFAVELHVAPALSDDAPAGAFESLDRFRP